MLTFNVMYFVSLLLFTVFLLISESSQGQPHVCVIGGGISGLTVALKLQEFGYPVSLFEATSRYGGKVETYRAPEAKNLILEKGPVILSPWMNHTLGYCKQFGIPLSPYYINSKVLYNTDNGKLLGSFTLTNKAQKDLLELADRYEKEFRLNEKYIKEVGYSNILSASPDLVLPISEFLEKKGLSGLTPIFLQFITLFGYGDIREIPTFYGMRSLFPEHLKNIISGERPFLTAKYGFDTLIRKMAASVSRKFLRHEAIDIKRMDRSGSLVKFLVDGAYTRQMSCAKTVLAFPPTLGNLAGILDLSLEERRLFENVKLTKYARSGHVISGLKDDAFVGLFPGGNNTLQYPAGRGEMFLLVKSQKGGNPNAYMGYSWLGGEFDDAVNEKDIRLMKRKMNAVIEGILLEGRSSTYFLAGSQFFPRVGSEAVRQGFFKKLEEMQGKSGVYFASTMLSFENTNMAIEMGETLVERYFTRKNNEL